MGAADWSTLVFTLLRRKIAWVHPTKATFFQNCTLILDMYPVVSENKTLPPAISPAEMTFRYRTRIKITLRESNSRILTSDTTINTNNRQFNALQSTRATSLILGQRLQTSPTRLALDLYFEVDLLPKLAKSLEYSKMGLKI